MEMFNFPILTRSLSSVHVAAGQREKRKWRRLRR